MKVAIARHPRLAKRSDKRRSRARLCRSFPAISCVTCRAGDADASGGSYFYVGQYARPLSRRPDVSARLEDAARARPTPVAAIPARVHPRDRHSTALGHGLERFTVVNGRLRAARTAPASVLPLLDCACIHSGAAAVKRLRAGPKVDGAYPRPLIRRRCAYLRAACQGSSVK